jgi:hypothetical protein
MASSDRAALGAGMKSSNSKENAERRSSVIHFSQIIYYYESISKSLKEIYTAVYKNLL